MPCRRGGRYPASGCRPLTLTLALTLTLTLTPTLTLALTLTLTLTLTLSLSLTLTLTLSLSLILTVQEAWPVRRFGLPCCLARRDPQPRRRHQPRAPVRDR